MNPAGQLDLVFDRPPGQAPKVTATDVNELIEALFRAHTWMTATDLGFHTENDKRILRALAAASGGHVISGQAGYRLNFEATADESRVSVGWKRGMLAELTQRILEEERVYHRKEVPEILRDRVEAARPAA
jgi:hypothetical protein